MKSLFENEFVLIQHLKKGDEDAYVFLVDRFNAMLCAYANSLTNDPTMAQDIVQQVFIKVWEQRARMNSNFSFSNFLHKLVYNEFVDLYRKNQAVTLLEKKYIDALNTIIEEDTSLFEKRIALIKREIQNLPPKCQQVFLLSKQEGLTNLEIAKYLNVSIKSVEGHITKALSILRKKMKADVVDGFLFILFPQHKNKATTAVGAI